MATVSIAMATYNGARYIREQLDSLAKQTLLPIELIVTDDGSIDDTVALVEDFAKQAPFPVAIHRNPERLGYAANFMQCTNLCKGDLIAFCDQDDIWNADKLAVCVQTIEGDSNAYMVYHNANIFRSDGKIVKSLYRKSDESIAALRKPFSRPVSFYALGFTTVYKRDLLSLNSAWSRSFDYNGKHHHITHDIWISLLSNLIGPVLYIQEPLALYRLHENNVSLKGSGLFENILRNIRLSIDLTYNTYMLYSKIADLVLSAETQSQSLFCESLSISAKKLRIYADWMRLRSKLYCEPNFFKRVFILTRLVSSGAYRPHCGLGVRSILKDLLIGLFAGGPGLAIHR